MADAIVVDVGSGVRVPAIRPEDLAVTKILAGCPRDLDDVHGVLLAAGCVLSYLVYAIWVP